MQLRPLGHKAKDILRNEGFGSFVNRTRRFLKHEVFRGSYQDRRIDVESRYELIKEGIGEEGENLLDIGCAEGYFTTKFAEDGYFTIGVDLSVSRLNRARKSNPNPTSPQFIYLEITPDNIGKLPEFDVVLLLTVYHHWVDAYGLDSAERMLKILASKSDVLIFEPPGRELSGMTETVDEYSSVEGYYHSYLDELFPEVVEIHFLGTAPYVGTHRTDPLFAIRCNEFSVSNL